MKAEQGANKFQSRTRVVAQPVINVLWNIDRIGYDRLPDDGPAILCANHISFIDSIFLGLTVPRNISFVGKAEYLDSWKTKYIFPALGMIPIDRSGGTKSQGALDAAEQVLRRGEFFGIFPEGTRSRDGDLYKGRTGAARLAMKLGCPIFPVGITGTDDVQPIDTKFPRPRKECTFNIGRPIHPERYAGRGAEHLAWRSMTDEVMYEIREMTGQVYKNHYAGESDHEVHEPSKVATVTDPDVGANERRLVAVGR